MSKKEKEKVYGHRNPKSGKCTFCPAHDGENRGRRPKSDKHKNKRRK